MPPWFLATGLLGMATPLWGAEPALPALPAPASATIELFLDVSLNGEALGIVARFTRTPAGGLRTTPRELRELGLDPAKLGLRADAGAENEEVDLDAVPGLSYTWDPASQSVALRLADALRTPTRLDMRTARPFEAGSASRGLLLNYDLDAQFGTSRRVAALNEVRVFGFAGVFSTSGVATLTGARRGYLRHESSWSWTDPVALTSLQVGDLVNRSLSWTRSLRMGGVEWRKSFELRPDLVTYPVGAMTGSAVVPSSVSLYVDGIRQFSAEVPDGPFALGGIAGLNGAGQATVVTRDALGRELATTLPLYIDTRLLAPGLSDYAIAAGLPRRDFGLRSSGYASSPVTSASLRHGLNDYLTLEAHGEAGRGLGAGGAGALLRLGQYGVLHGALAASRASQGDGVQGSLGYQYLSARWSLDAQSLRASPGYADLGTQQGTPASRVSDRLSLSLALAAGQSLSASYIGYRAPGGVAARLVSLAYALRLGPSAVFGVNAYRDLGDRETRGLTATLSVGLPGRTGANAGVGSRAGERSRNASIGRAAEADGGIGWSLQALEQGGQRYSQGQLNYLGGMGQLNARMQRGGATRDYAVGAAGSLLAMDGTVLAARQVGRSFALVSTGLADVPVLQENRAVGRTDAGGRFLVPDLVPYAANRLAIDTSELALDAHVIASSRDVVPQRLAGLVARFTVERLVAATVILHGRDGKAVPLGTAVEVEGGDATVVGHDGIVFIAHARPRNRLLVRTPDGACATRFAFNPAAGATLAAIGPLYCEPIDKP